MPGRALACVHCWRRGADCCARGCAAAGGPAVRREGSQHGCARVPTAVHMRPAAPQLLPMPRPRAPPPPGAPAGWAHSCRALGSPNAPRCRLRSHPWQWAWPPAPQPRTCAGATPWGRHQVQRRWQAARMCTLNALDAARDGPPLLQRRGPLCTVQAPPQAASQPCAPHGGAGPPSHPHDPAPCAIPGLPACPQCGAHRPPPPTSRSSVLNL